MKLLHVSALLVHPQATVHLLKLLHCISSYVKMFQCCCRVLFTSKYICLRNLSLSLLHYLLAASVFVCCFVQPCGVVFVVISYVANTIF